MYIFTKSRLQASVFQWIDFGISVSVFLMSGVFWGHILAESFEHRKYSLGMSSAIIITYFPMEYLLWSILKTLVFSL